MGMTKSKPEVTCGADWPSETNNYGDTNNSILPRDADTVLGFQLGPHVNRNYHVARAENASVIQFNTPENAAECCRPTVECWDFLGTVGPVAAYGTYENGKLTCCYWKYRESCSNPQSIEGGKNVYWNRPPACSNNGQPLNLGEHRTEMERVEMQRKPQ